MTEAVPLIDIGKLKEDSSAVEEIGRACRDWGFFQIVNHGISDVLIDELYRQSRSFFSLPGKEKHKILRTQENVWGFYDQELTKNRRDWKEVFDFGASKKGPTLDGIAQWPSNLPGFRETLTEYYSACEKLSLMLLEGILKSLGLQGRELHRCFQPVHSSFLRLNYYPQCSQPGRPDSTSENEGGHFGISRHTDAGALTVLFQDQVAGLQVLRGNVWHTIEPHRGALVVNIGDIVQVWSNDKYKAALHRVTANTDHERYSAPFFFNPSYDTNYAPLDKVISDMDPARYRELTWSDFRKARALGDYADYGEEIQISQFRI